MTPSIKLVKKIVVDDPRNLSCYVTLTVIEAVGITNNIFVVKYSPPMSPNDQGGKLFYNVAYADQLEDLPVDPVDKFSPCFLLSHTVTKALKNKETAEWWCGKVYDEIKRLISTVELKDGDTITTTVDVYETYHTESTPVVSDSSEHVSTTDFGEYSVRQQGNIDTTEEYIGDVVNLTFDGKELSE